MQLLILGGDGFCGWPTALHLSAHGHDVTIVDSCVRRRIDDELGVRSLTPIRLLPERLDAWKSVTGRSIDFVEMDLAEDYSALTDLLATKRPDAVVHFAEQRAAPYSMKSSAHKRYTIQNNVAVTHNLLAGVVESGLDCHIVHLGTMGGLRLRIRADGSPRGYLTVAYPDRTGAESQSGNSLSHAAGQRVPPQQVAGPATVPVLREQRRCTHHRSPPRNRLGYADRRNRTRSTARQQVRLRWRLRNGSQPVPGRSSDRSSIDSPRHRRTDPGLHQYSRHSPLHPVGGGIRCRGIRTSTRDEPGDRNPPGHRLAHLVADLVGAEVELVPNPRKEADENELRVRNDRLVGLGLEPIYLATGLLTESVEIAQKYADRIERDRIVSTSYWNRSRRAAAEEHVYG